MYKFNKASNSVLKQLLFDFYTTFDFFGQRPMLRIFKNRKFSTSLGFILSLTLMIICGIFLIVQFQSLVLRTNPSTSITENLSIDTQPFPLLISNFTLGMLLTYQNMTQMNTLGTHWNMEVQNCHRVKLKDPLTNQTMVSQNCTTYPIDPCGPEHFVTQTQKDYYSQAKLGYVYCLKADVWTKNPPVLQGTVQGQVYQYLTIKVSACKNTTEKQECASQEEIKKELSNGYFALQIEDNLVKMKNSESPFQDMISLSYSSFSISSSKTIFQYLKSTDSISDKGLFTEDLEQESKLVLSSMKESQDLYNDKFLMLQYLMLDSRSISYYRTYPRIQDVIGKVGGLWSAIFVILHVMLKPITFLLMNLTMANKLFRFEIEEVDEIKEDFNISKQPQQKIQDFHSSIQCPQTERGEKVSNLYLSVNQQRSKTEFDQIKDKNQIRQFLKKKKKQTQIGWKHLILIMLGCKKKVQTQLDYANNKVKEKLDIAYILKKLYELEKLKFILLNEDQLSLFNYLPKPLIPSEMFNKDFEQKIVEFERNKAYKFILQEEKSDIIKMQEAYISYQKIQQLSQKSQIDCSLLGILDTEIVDFFERLNNDQTKSDIVFQNSPVILSRHQDLELIRSIRYN